MVGKNRLHLPLGRQPGQGFVRPAVLDHQPGILAPGLAAELAQVFIELDQAADNKLHPAVGAWQGVENLAVEHEQAQHLAAVRQRLVQRLLIVRAQVAPKPDQAAFVSCVHGRMLERRGPGRTSGLRRSTALRGCCARAGRTRIRP